MQGCHQKLMNGLYMVDGENISIVLRKDCTFYAKRDHLLFECSWGKWKKQGGNILFQIAKHDSLVYNLVYHSRGKSNDTTYISIVDDNGKADKDIGYDFSSKDSDFVYIYNYDNFDGILKSDLNSGFQFELYNYGYKVRSSQVEIPLFDTMVFNVKSTLPCRDILLLPEFIPIKRLSKVTP